MNINIEYTAAATVSCIVKAGVVILVLPLCPRFKGRGRIEWNTGVSPDNSLRKSLFLFIDEEVTSLAAPMYGEKIKQLKSRWIRVTHY